MFSPNTAPRRDSFPGNAVMLTGATSSLGACVLCKPLSLPSPSLIYCLVRAESAQHAHDFVLNSFQTHQVISSSNQTDIIIAPSSDLSSASLGLASNVLEQLSKSTTHMIRTAWPVNSMLPLSSFEKHVTSTHNILRFPLFVPYPNPVKLIYDSSLSTAGPPSQKTTPKTPTSRKTSLIPALNSSPTTRCKTPSSTQPQPQPSHASDTPSATASGTTPNRTRSAPLPPARSMNPAHG